MTVYWHNAYRVEDIAPFIRRMAGGFRWTVGIHRNGKLIGTMHPAYGFHGISLEQFRSSMSGILDDIEDGQAGYYITYRGNTVALIMSLPKWETKVE